MNKYIEIIENREGLKIPIVNIGNSEIKLHSYYSSEYESNLIYDNYFISEVSKYLFVGFGFGHHINKFLKEKTVSITIIILNKKIFDLAIKYSYIEKYINKNIKFIYIKNLEKKQLKKILLSYKGIVYHTPSIQLMDNEVKKEIIMTQKIKNNSYTKNKKIIEKNYKENTRNISRYLNDFYKMISKESAIVVGAGPSLDKDIEIIKSIRKENFVFAVGTALIPMVKSGITPDAVIISDPHSRVIEQIKNVNLDIPLVILDTSSHLLSSYWKGKIYLCTLKNQKFDDDNRNIVRSGGSVITVAFDIIVKSNVKKIILAGADFSYTNNFSHTKNAHMRKKVDFNDNSLLEIKNYQGQFNRSSKNLIIYKKWIENYSAKIDKPVYNITHNGAIIKNTIRLDFLKDVNTENREEKNNE